MRSTYLPSHARNGSKSMIQWANLLHTLSASVMTAGFSKGNFINRPCVVLPGHCMIPRIQRGRKLPLRSVHMSRNKDGSGSNLRTEPLWVATKSL